MARDSREWHPTSTRSATCTAGPAPMLRELLRNSTPRGVRRARRWRDAWVHCDVRQIGSVHRFFLIRYWSVGQGEDDVIGDDAAEVRESRHVGELDGGPLPATGFAPDHGDGGHTLQSEGIEDEQCDGAAEGHFAAQGLAQSLRLGFTFDSVDGPEGADDNLASGQ